MKLRIATRKSTLALWQARHVASLLNALDEVETTELVPIVTTGDRILDQSLSKIGGKGLFIKELEQAMLDGRADLAVHSMKDVPVEPPTDFAFPAVLGREDPRDALVGCSLRELPPGACVGTSSLRRQSQLLAIRPDISVRPVRGNVETRLRKCGDGEFDAVMLAVAGLKRLGLSSQIAEILEPEQILPAGGQGIVGIECSAENPGVMAVLGQLNNPESSVAVRAERAVAAGLTADCRSPVGALASVDDDSRLRLKAIVGTPDGHRIIHASAEGDIAGVMDVAERVVSSLTSQGALALLSGRDE